MAPKLPPATLLTITGDGGGGSCCCCWYGGDTGDIAYPGGGPLDVAADAAAADMSGDVRRFDTCDADADAVAAENGGGAPDGGGGGGAGSAPTLLCATIGGGGMNC